MKWKDKQVIDGNALRAEMIQKEVDHLKWAEEVNRLLTNNRGMKFQPCAENKVCVATKG